MVWAWMPWLPYVSGPRTLLWFGHGWTGYRVLLDHERYYDLSMDALLTVRSWTTNVIMVWAWMQNTNVIMVWAWMPGLPYALEPRTLLWFGHACDASRVLLDRERYYGLGMDAVVTVCFWTTNVCSFNGSSYNGPRIPEPKAKLRGRAKKCWPAWDFEYTLHVLQQDLPAEVTAIRGH